MGSGNRFVFYTFKGLMFGVAFDTFPFALTVDIHFGFCGISLGFGKAYDK